MRIAIVAVAAGLTLTLSASAQDVIEYTDKDGSVKKTSGTIAEEGPGGVKVTVAGGAATVNLRPDQIVKLTYSDLPAALKIEYSQAINKDSGKEYAEALTEYQNLLEQIPVGLKSRRQVEYRIAMIQAAQASEMPGAELDAVAALKSFVTSHPNSWQFVSAAQSLASLQMSTKDYAAALGTLEKLSAVEGLPEESKKDLQLMTIDALLLSDQRTKAKTVIDGAIGGLRNTDPQKKRLEVIALLTEPDAKSAESITTVKGVIDNEDDPDLRALAYNTLGDLQRRAGSQRDAMWSYLWVDVVYSQDQNERLKAVSRLIDVFERLGETERAERYKEKLRELR